MFRFLTIVILATALGSATSQAQSKCSVTLEKYKALKSGMKLPDAISILGCEGTEISSSKMAGITTEMYSWDGSSFASNMNAMFQNGKMIGKAQFGLQ